jgi:hypothetical protein
MSVEYKISNAAKKRIHAMTNIQLLRSAMIEYDSPYESPYRDALFAEFKERLDKQGKFVKREDNQ